MEKKIRIQLFDEEGRLYEDRLVSQDSEIYAGPKLEHKSLMRIEFTLESPEDIGKAKTYLDQIIGNLPLGSKKVRKKSLKFIEDDSDSRDEFLKLSLTHISDQDEFIGFLRKNGFRFMMTDFLKSFDFPGLVIKERHLEKQWMIRCIKEAKSPKSDKYDPMLIFGIQLLPEHDERIVIYLNGEFHKSIRIPLPEKPKEVFKKTKMIKFPEYMTLEEREKFRYELRQYENQSDRPYSKFYRRWKPYVENLPQLSQDKNNE